MTNEVHAESNLHIEVSESLLQLIVSFVGTSDARDPTPFIEPILKRVAEQARNHSKLMVLDFRRLERMNSSSVPPIVRVLDTARRGQMRLKVIYDRTRRWQATSFSALKAFETLDGRIAILPA
ncbi:MAG: hypothetical protein M3Y59_24055 [Myxococcota bacterium]|nr:hypothetical protein [Myxococcota bacterium]